jgi:hypothetical protein
MEKRYIDPTTINGWGIDNDPENEPTYPVKKYTGDDHDRIQWIRPTLQEVNIELLKSTERPYPSAVFGSKLPPKGLSGVIRRLAFKRSENMFRHWIPLLLADRIDVVEAFFSDLFHGRLPRVYKERGWSMLGKHQPWALVKRILWRILVIAVIILLIMYVRNHFYSD